MRKPYGAVIWLFLLEPQCCLVSFRLYSLKKVKYCIINKWQRIAISLVYDFTILQLIWPLYIRQFLMRTSITRTLDAAMQMSIEPLFINCFWFNSNNLLVFLFVLVQTQIFRSINRGVSNRSPQYSILKVKVGRCSYHLFLVNCEWNEEYEIENRNANIS